MRRTMGWASLAAAAVTSTYGVWQLASLPASRLVTHVADDTFYYLVLARNLADVGRLTFDGVNPASGVHPAWLALTALLSAAGLEGIALVRAAIVLAFVCHIAAALLVMRIVQEAGVPEAAPWCGALWLANPVSLLLVVEAMEAPLFIAVLAGAALMVQRLMQGEAITKKGIARVSALLGLLCLVRTDGVMVAGACAVVAAMALGLRGWGLRSSVRVPAGLLAGPLVATIMFAIWLKAHTGYFTQASGELKMFWGSAATAAERLDFLSHVIVRLTFGLFGHSMLGLPVRVSAIAGAAALAAVLVSGWLGFRRGNRSALFPSMWLLIAAATATTLYATVLFEYRAWYLGLPAFAMFMAVVLEAARRARPAVFAIGASLALAAMVAQDIRLARGGIGRYPYAAAIYESVALFDSIVPDGEPIAAFDAGVRGFFARHRIINLDGLVNDATREYWKAGRLDLYLEREGVTYVADEPGQFDVARQFTVLPAMDPVACVPVDAGAYRDRCLWIIRR